MRAGSRMHTSPSRAGRHSLRSLSKTGHSSATAAAGDRGDVGGLAARAAPARRAPSSAWARRRAARRRDRARAAPAGPRRAAGTRAASRERLDQLVEDVVDPREHLRRGAEVAREEPRRRAARSDPARRGTWRCRRAGSGRSTASGSPTKNSRPGSTLISFHGRSPSVGIVGAEQRGQLDLDRIGVLELVDQDALVALPQAGAGRGAVLGIAQQRAREHEQVVEVELAGDRGARRPRARCTPRSRRPRA